MELISVRRLTVAAPVVSLRLADLTDRRVLGNFDIAGDVSAGVDYTPAQRWAHRFLDARFDGIYYAARHDPQFTERSIAVFGRQGDRSAEERKRFEWTTYAVPDDAVRELVEHFGIIVVPYEDLNWTWGPEV